MRLQNLGHKGLVSIGPDQLMAPIHYSLKLSLEKKTYEIYAYLPNLRNKIQMCCFATVNTWQY